MLSISSGMLFANPIPKEFSIPRVDIESIISRAVIDAERNNKFGKDITPFVLSRINILAKGRSIIANKALVKANVQRGAAIAKALSSLQAFTGNSSCRQVRKLED